MEQRQAGITALGTAYARAYHALHESPKIFDDFLAPQWFSEDERRYIDQNLALLLPMIDPALAASNPDTATATAAVVQLIHAPVTLSRSRFTEDRLEEVVRQGVRQYVILGAGFDTFAFRRPEWAAAVQVFEVDHPATQALKRERMALPGWELPAQAHFVPVDFTQDNLADALRRSPYDSQQASFVSWLGVTFYLPRESVFATLSTLAHLTSRGSTLVFDYMDADAFIPERAGRRIQIMQGVAQHVGEPMQTGFDPLTLGDDLAHCGWTLVDNLSPAAIDQRYFQGRADRYHAFEHVHFARAVIA